MKKGYYTEEIIRKFAEALNDAKKIVKAEDRPRVKISNANSKMGAVASVSQLPFLTCPGCCERSCGAKCYAAKLANLRPSVLKAWAYNTALAIYRPLEYWAGVSEAVGAVKYFRFHVSGDIPNMAYFRHVVDVAREHSGTEILMFTKRWAVVNEWIGENGPLPSNLHVMFSGWDGLQPDNPYGLPETNVIMKGSEPREGWKLCGGKCETCAARGVGCWTATTGDVIAFNEH